MQLSFVCNPVRTVVAIMAIALLSACTVPLVQVETKVNVTCPDGQSGDPSTEEPGVNCGGSNKIAVPAGTPVATNAVPVNPTSGTIPPGATCSSANPGTQSFKCKAGIPGASCGIPAVKKCRDTYNIGNTVCDCLCL